MKAEVIGISIIDTSKLLKIVKDETGDKINDILDKSSIPLTDKMAQFYLLERFQNDQAVIGRELGNVCYHSFLSILVEAHEQDFSEFKNHTRLNFLEKPTAIRGQYLAVMSGDLANWRDTMINCCQKDVSTNIRMFADSCVVAIERFGLQKLFAHYAKRKQPDGTFTLES